MRLRLIYGILFIAAFISCKNDVKMVKDSSEPKNEKIQDTLIMEVDKNILLGHFEPQDHPLFAKIDKKYADRSGLYLQKETLLAFITMFDAAGIDGIHFTIKSATRNFDYQKGIWERKWNGSTTLSDGTNAAKDISDPVERARKILEYSSMPGTSRHHWGTDFDINSFNNTYFESGKGLKEYNWLKANASTYGFCQPYTSKESGRKGYNEEKWHWSYNPLSKPYNNAIKSQISYADIGGFLGSNTAKELNVIDDYILGIGNLCR